MMVQKSPEINDKPFACTAQGCDMTFTNKDHLEWHNKKHEMMLNLGLINKNMEVADQTPTPTRFIRNCEEVGLFQDLNVNPFDELFRKAADLAKNGVTIDVQATNSDDTLHTPHILPITEHQLRAPEINQKNDSDCEMFYFSTNDNNSDSEDCIIINSDEISNVKKTIQANILKKKSPVIKVIPFENLAEDSNNERNKNHFKENKSKLRLKPTNRIEQIRESNRAAQLRSRRKKRELWKEMQQKILVLEAENKKLRLSLEELRLVHSKCAGNNSNIFEAPAIPLMALDASLDSKTPQVPFLIQVIPHSQISVVPTSSRSAEGDGANKQIFRKIAPLTDKSKKKFCNLKKEK